MANKESAQKFSQELTQFSQELEKLAANFLVNTAVTVAGRIVGKTPYDTGTARKNWNFSVGSPDTTTYEKQVYSEYSDKAFSGQSQLVAEQQAEDIFGPVRTSGHLPKLYIANSLEYIGDLNDGTSQQAPQGFVETTVLEIESELT